MAPLTMKHAVKNNARRGGFTVTEMLVAVSLFVVFLSVGVGSFDHILRMQRLLSRRIALVSSLSIVAEQMEREIRTGFNYPVNVSLSSQPSLTFDSLAKYPPESVTFALQPSVDPRYGAAITRNGVSITPSTMKIKTLSFIVSEVQGVTSLKCAPWKITLYISAVPVASDTPEDTVYMQSTVTSRTLPEDVRNDPYNCKG